MTDYEYTTPEMVQAELQSTTSFSASTVPKLDTVQQWIYETSDYINQMSGRTYSVNQYVDYLDYDGSTFLTPRHSPIVGITKLEYNTNPLGQVASWSTLTADLDYALDEYPSQVILPFTSFRPVEGPKRFRITYLAGDIQTPYNITMLATKMVTDRVISSLLNQHINEGNDGGSISVGSISIVEPASYGVQNYKRLKDDIKGLQDDLLKNKFGVFRYG